MSYELEYEQNHGSGYALKEQFKHARLEYESGYGSKTEYQSGYGYQQEYEHPTSENKSGYGWKTGYRFGYGQKKEFLSGYEWITEYEEPTSEDGSLYDQKSENEASSLEYGSWYTRYEDSEKEGHDHKEYISTMKPMVESEKMSSSSTSSFSSQGKCHRISLDEIKVATDNFNEKNVLGKGGEAKVYLAKIKLGSEITKVVVKHLKPNSEEFDEEIKIVSKIQHPNIVSLLGYCNESGQKILLYEYMKNKSLSEYVKKRSSISLSWVQRLHICLDAANGLKHLHSETDEYPKGIVHRDVKPDNILIGKDWVAKISDFGMFKLSHVGQVQSTIYTLLKGTGGYFAPEYIERNAITRKIDVYGFGVVMFQVLCLKMPWDRADESYYVTDDDDLGDWAQQNIDGRIKAEIFHDSLKEFTAIIGKSLKRDPRKRPTMDGVVLGLEKALKCQEEHDDEARKLE